MNDHPGLIRSGQQLLTLWVGALLAIGDLAVPVLFYHLDDRQLAGELAGQMFQLVYGLGLFCGLSLVMIAFVSCRFNCRSFFAQWRHSVLLAMVVLVALGLFVLQPQMAAIKLQPAWQDQAGLMIRFGRLHGIASALYLLTSLLGVVLVIKGLRAEAGR